jgi:hypothetical protein
LPQWGSWWHWKCRIQLWFILTGSIELLLKSCRHDAPCSVHSHTLLFADPCNARPQGDLESFSTLASMVAIHGNKNTLKTYLVPALMCWNLHNKEKRFIAG